MTRKRPRPKDPDALSPEQLAEMLGVTERTLMDWRMKGTGPRYTKAGRSIWYSRRWLDEWKNARSVICTDESKPYRPGAR